MGLFDFFKNKDWQNYNKENSKENEKLEKIENNNESQEIEEKKDNIKKTKKNKEETYQITKEENKSKNKQQNKDEKKEAEKKTNQIKKPKVIQEKKDNPKNKSDKPLILSIINQKGGVGKSTTAINLSAALGQKGKKVLLIDFDPQGNTTSGLGVDKNDLDQCVYDVLLNDVDINDVKKEEVVKNLDLVPSTINLAGAEVELVTEIAREQKLKNSIKNIIDNYDYIFIDCPPSLGLLTVNALVAADKLLIPIQCEFYALEGVTKLLDSMKRVKNALNPTLDVFGVVLTMYDNRTTLSKQVSEEVKNFFGAKVFDSKIPRTVKISEAPSFGVPINEYDPICKGSVMYESLAEEVIDRG